MESIQDSPNAHKLSDYANGQVNNFLDSVEDLTKALKDIDTPDIARVRTKVKIALVAAKSAVADTASQLRDQAQEVSKRLRDQAQDVSKRTDTYVRDNPWQVVGIAAVIGLAVGFLASRRS
jgi:ElaB/YqjD/DUF883 family membrane-anchored ribosome-binding protein